MTTIDLQDYAICSLGNSQVFLAVKRSDSINSELRQLEGILVSAGANALFWHYDEQVKVASLFDREVLIMRH